MISDQLKEALGTHGWWKLAQEVKRSQGMAAPAEVTLQSGVESLAMKLAADLVNESVIERGIASYRKVQGSR